MKDLPLSDAITIVSAIAGYIGTPTLVAFLSILGAGYYLVGWLARKHFAGIRIIEKGQKVGSKNAEAFSSAYEKRIRWFLMAMLLLAAGYLPTMSWWQGKLEAIQKNMPPPSFLKAYEWFNNQRERKLVMTVDGRFVAHDAQAYKAMWFCRAYDLSIDFTSDYKIDKSRLFEIIPGDLTIEIPLFHSLLNQKNPDAPQVQCFFFLIPKGQSQEDLLTHNQMLRIGARSVAATILDANVAGASRR